MNRLGVSVWLIWAGMASTCLNAQTPVDTFAHAHAHYNFILEAFNEVGDAADVYLAFSVHSEDSSLIKDQRRFLQQTIQKARQRVANRPGYQGDTRVKQGLLDLFDMYEEVFQDRVFTVETLGEREKKYARQEIQYEWQALAEAKMAKSRNDFLIQRMYFARDHAIQRRSLPGTFVHQRINELMDYCVQIEWARVRVVRQHAGFLDAMEAADSLEMKRRRWRLLGVASQMYNEVAGLPNFYGEAAYRQAAMGLFRFYRDLAAQDLPAWISLVALGSGGTRAYEDPPSAAEAARLAAFTHAIEQRNASVARYNRQMPPLRDRYFVQRKLLQRKYVPRDLGKK